jgi:hypothetical protein
MRLLHTSLALAVSWTAAAVAQTSAPTPLAPESPLPVRRVVLYKTGVGYFEHLGTVRERQEVAIRFTSAQLNDVLKSLTAIDLGKALHPSARRAGGSPRDASQRDGANVGHPRQTGIGTERAHPQNIVRGEREVMTPRERCVQYLPCRAGALPAR